MAFFSRVFREIAKKFPRGRARDNMGGAGLQRDAPCNPENLAVDHIFSKELYKQCCIIA